MLALYIVGGVVTYIVVSGVVAEVSGNKWKDPFPLLWPFISPALLGSHLVKKVEALKAERIRVQLAKATVVSDEAR
jgi:hypothetical protein